MESVVVETESGVMSLRLNRSEKKNALTVEMYATLADGLERAAEDPGIRVVILEGHESVFCAGNDLEDFRMRPDDVQPVGRRFGERLYKFPKPLVASVCGAAVGIGTTMLAHFDIVYAGDNARFSLPFVNLGLVPEAGSTITLPRLFGHHRAAELMLMGESFDAETACAWGFVNRVVPFRQCAAFARERASLLASKPAVALMETKRLMKLQQLEPLEIQKREEGAVFDRLLVGPAAREAFTAFKEKRAPDFSKY